MQRKPQPAFDRFNEKPAFRGDRFSEGGDRFGGERRPRFSNDRFEDRGSRFGGDRFDRGDRFGGDRGGRFADRGERFGGDRFERREGAFGGNRRFNDGKPFRRFDRSEPRFGTVPARARRPLKPAATRTVPPLCRRRPCGLMPMWPRTLRTLRP